MLDAGLAGTLWVTCSLQAPERQRGPGRIATAIRPAISRDRSPSQSMELHTPLSQLVRGCASPRQTALASTAYPLPAGKDVFLNFGPVSSDAGPLRSRRSHRPSPWPPVPQPMPMLSGSAGSERSHVSSMSGSACFSACLRSFSASRSSSRVLNLSVSAFFVLMGFGGSCGACGGVSRACGRSCGLSAGSGLEGACGAPEGRWRRLTAVRMPCAWSESRPEVADLAVPSAPFLAQRIEHRTGAQQPGRWA